MTTGVINANPVTTVELAIAASFGRVPDASSRTSFGNITNMNIADAPITLWDANILRTRIYSPVGFTIQSSSANDTASGTGAQIVLITFVDGNYLEQTVVVSMNGVSVVTIPGTYLHVQNALVISTGSGRKNAGNITIKEIGGNTTQGYLPASVGMDRKSAFMVPAGKTFVVRNFFGLANVPFGVTSQVVLRPVIIMPNGTEVQALPAYLSAGLPANITVPDAFSVPEKTIISYEVASVESNSTSIAWGFSGTLF